MGYVVTHTTGYRAAERAAVFLPRERVSDIPVLFFHGGGGTWQQWFDSGPAYLPGEAAARGFVGLASDAAGLNPWGNASMAGPGTNAIDQLIDWAHTNYGTRTDKVALVGLSHGASALNWAWRNPTKVAAFLHVLPGVNMQRLYERNPVGLIVPQMNSAYGSAGAVVAAYPTRDPCHAANVALQRPIADRMAVWYGLDDTVTLPAEVAAWAADIRIPATDRHPMTGVGHDFDFDWDPPVDWLFNQVYYPHR